MNKINFVNGQSPALNATNLNQMQENFEDFVNEYTENYSSTEQKIGKWIDGKDIYRKCYHVANKTINSTATDVFLTDNLSNCETFVKIYGTILLKNTANETYYLNILEQTLRGRMILRVLNKNLQVVTLTQLYTDYFRTIEKLDIILEYTKV